MNIKNNQKSQNSITKINQALCLKLSQKEHKNITIKEICEEANINRCTFYAHFDSIEDALYKLCENHIIKIYNIFLNTNIPYASRIEQSLIVMKNNYDFFNYLFSNVNNLESRIMEMLENSITELEDQLSTETSKMCLSFIICGLIGLGKTYFKDQKENNTHISLKELVKIICSLINMENPYFKIK